MTYVIQQKFDDEWETVSQEETPEDAARMLMDYVSDMWCSGLAHEETSGLLRMGIEVAPGVIAVIDHFDFDGGE